MKLRQAFEVGCKHSVATGWGSGDCLHLLFLSARMACPCLHGDSAHSFFPWPQWLVENQRPLGVYLRSLSVSIETRIDCLPDHPCFACPAVHLPLHPASNHGLSLQCIWVCMPRRISASARLAAHQRCSSYFKHLVSVPHCITLRSGVRRADLNHTKCRVLLKLCQSLIVETACGSECHSAFHCCCAWVTSRELLT